MTEKTLPPKPSDLGYTEAVDRLFGEDAPKLAATGPALKDRRPLEIAEHLTARLGRTWLVWEPETLWAELRRLGETLSEPLKNKISAARTLFVSDVFWRDHLAFEKVALAFNDRIPLFDQYQHPSPAMLANAVEEAAKIRRAAFSEEVLRYIAAVALDDGLVALPEPLTAAQPHLDTLLSPEGRTLRDDVLAGAGPFDETPAGIQRAKRAAILEYVKAY